MFDDGRKVGAVNAALLLLTLALALGIAAIGILVQGLRAQRDDAGLDDERASLVAERAARAETRGDETADPGVSADDVAEARMSVVDFETSCAEWCEMRTR
jgi:hypothetical protein